MANKVSILIMNTQGHHFELTNSKMTLQRAGTLDMNWRTAIGHECGPNDIILSDFSGSSQYQFGTGVYLLQECSERETADMIISECRKKLKDQYERMMEIRVAKKYKLNPLLLSKIELEFHNPDNYEVDIGKFLSDAGIQCRKTEEPQNYDMDKNTS